MEISENRPLYFCLLLRGYAKGENGLEQRQKRGSQTERSMATAVQRARKKIKCFSLLLGGSRCAGLVTLATGNRAEHLIGACVSVTCRGGQDVQMENQYILHL